MKRFIALTLVAVMAVTLFAGCSKKNTDATTAAPKNPEVKDIWTKIEEKIGKDNMPSLMDADAEMISTFYYVKAEDIESYAVKFPMMNVKAEEYFLAKVKDGKMDAVKEGIEKRKADLDAQWKQYLPDQYELVKKAQTVINGNYILFAVGDNADKAVEVFNAETK